MRTGFKIAAVASALGAMGVVAQAAPITVQNFSFESPGGPTGQYPPATSWPGSSFTEISADIGVSGGTGARYNGQESGTAANQDLGVTFLANTKYTLTVAIGNRTSDPANPTGTARFGITAGGTEQGTFTTAVSPVNTFQDFTYLFTTGTVAPTGNVGIRLGATGGRGLFDNVRLDASPVPEPASLGLLALTGSGLLARRRRNS